MTDDPLESLLGPTLIEETALAARVDTLAAEIARAAPRKDLLVVGLLTGSFIFVADLLRALGRHGLRPEVEFVRTSLYLEGSEPGENVVVRGAFEVKASGRAVLVVDDILDSGRSMEHVCGLVAAQDPAWLRSCVLLDKPARRSVPRESDFVGFTIPDKWVVGYGLDHAGFLRDLPYIAELKPPPE